MTRSGRPGRGQPLPVGAASRLVGLVPVLLVMGGGGLWRLGAGYWPGWLFLGAGVVVGAAALRDRRRLEVAHGLDGRGTRRLVLALLAGILAGGLLYALLFTVG